MTASTHNRKIKNLLKIGVLTGFEMAKLVLRILWDSESKLQAIPHREVVRNFDPLLNVDEIESFLDKNLSQDYDKHVEFDNWTMAFPIMVYLRDKALILYLETTNTLSVTEAILEKFLTEAIIRKDIRRKPEIVTEKQYQDLKVQQREDLLQERYSLKQIIIQRAHSNAGPKYDEWSMGDLLEGSSKEKKDAVEYFKQACSEVYNYINEGKLSVTYQKRALSLLERIQTKPDNEILDIIESAISAEPKRKIKEPESYLDRITATGKALYNIGWLEWINWIDTYKHNLDKSAPHGVAILQDPALHQIDERGFYIKRNNIADHALIKMINNPIWGEIKLTPRLFFFNQLQKATQNIEKFLFYRGILRAVSDVLGFSLTDELDEWYKDLESIWISLEEGFDRIIGLSQEAKDVFNNILETNLEDLKPSPKVIEYMGRRVQEPLKVHEWLYDCEMANYKDKKK